jgi:hypothetical protein
MPDPKYTGSPSGSGNPPGKHSEGYLSGESGSEGPFVEKSSYRGDMHVGVPAKADIVGNQPVGQDTSDIKEWADSPAIPSGKV